MKKFFAILLLTAVLLSCCACGSNGDIQQTQPEKPGELTAEDMYGHIDQNTPIDGYYKVWNAEGVKNMANHPEGKFEILCNIDMGGAVIAPIQNFTGTIKGGNFTISSFTLQGSDGADFGFVTVNKGKIQNLLLSEVTFIPGSGAKNIGTLAGINEGEIQRCTVGGSMCVENAAADAFCGSIAGIATGNIANTVSDVDVTYTASGNAAIGGIAGRADGATIEYVDVSGSLTVTGGDQIAGLIAGSAKDTSFKSCAFLGEDNSMDGKLFNNFFGAEEGVTSEKLLWRDNSRAPEDPKIQELRQKAVQAMYEMCTIQWKPVNLVHTCNCSLTLCNGVYSDAYTYYGLPYNHKNGSLARMKYCLNEDGTVKDWVYELAAEGSFDTFDLYMGNDCSNCVQQAWLTVSNSVSFYRSSYQAPVLATHLDTGILPVGDYVWDLGLDITGAAWSTNRYTEHNGQEVMYKAYAQLRMGDSVCFFYDGSGHSRMCASDAVVVRDAEGNIDGQYSYIITHEQGVTMIDEEKKTYSSCKTFGKYTFENLYAGYYLPVTIEEFVTGQTDVPVCTLEGGVSDSRLGLTTGVVKANYSLDYVTMQITDSQGNTVFDHVMFPTVAKRLDNDSNDYRIRTVLMEYDLAGFAVPLREMAFQKGESYHATITGYLATGDSFVVNDFSFTNG